MTLEDMRAHMADYLREQGLDAVCAFPDGPIGRRAGPVVAVSLRDCQGGPAGFRDYLGERYNAETDRWEELYGRRARLTFGLDIYAPRAGGAQGAQGAFDALAEVLHRAGPEGLRVEELSCGETVFEQQAGLFRCPAQALCQAYLYAVTDEAGGFLDFTVRGERRL